MPKIKNIRANLECNNCEHRFVALFPHEAIEYDEGDPDWVPARDYPSGVKCPSCGSRSIGAR